MSEEQIELFETWSNIAYIICGFIGCFILQIMYPVEHGFLFGFSEISLGIASLVYHREKTSDRNHNVIWLFDWWAIAAINTVVAVVHFNNYWCSLILFLWHVVYSLFIMGRLKKVFIEVALSAVPAFIAIYLHRSLLTFLIVLGLFLIALLIRSRDEDPKQHKFHDSVYHSLWHILTAPMYLLAIYLDI